MARRYLTRALLLPLWTDDNGNFFLYSLHGTERDMIGWTHHENPCFISPYYWDLEGLYAALPAGCLRPREGIHR